MEGEQDLERILSQPRFISLNDIKRFCEATGDENPLHSNLKYAMRTCFRGIIVPGLFPVSYFELFEDMLGTRQEFTFLEAIKLEEMVRIRREGVERVYDRNLAVKREVKPLQQLSQKKDVKPQTYSDEITPERVREFLESLHLQQTDGEVPLMYAASLISPALIAVAPSKLNERSYIYRKVCFQFHVPPDFGEVRVRIENLGQKLGLDMYQLEVSQHKNTLLSAAVALFGLPLTEKINPHFYRPKNSV